ncbi:MAG TPA: glycosyltransferase [Miltoncostaeaceae bacterium]|nr:glycosyltransferase [Miltoncostaeaceae bacterium]
MLELPASPRWGPTVGRLLAVAAAGLGVLALLSIPANAVTTRSTRPVWAFFVPWDQASLVSFRHHAGQISVLLPSGLTMQGAGRVTDDVPHGLERLARRSGVRIDPVLSNFQKTWRSSLADRVLRSGRLRRGLAADLAVAAATNGWDGINVDLEGLPARDRVPLVAFAAALRRALGPGREVSVDVPAPPGPAYDLPALGREGRVLLMAYDQHASAGAAGPVAAASWIRARVADAAGLVGWGRLVVGLPTYGYAWRGRRPPVPLDATDALLIASSWHAMPQWSSAAAEPWFRVGDRTVWFADALSLAHDLRGLPADQPIALWHLGGEDAGIWTVLASRSPQPAALAAIAPATTVRLLGNGDIIHASAARTGTRVVSPGLRGERFTSLPQPWTLVRSGGGGGKRIALTFDDGPSPEWTPKILSELGRLRVPATFFVIGKNAAMHPSLVAQEVADGFTVGDHTFTHPELPTVSAFRARLEIATTARVIAGITGRVPRLFREPYAADVAPLTPGPVKPLLIAQRLGQTPVGASIDSQDYLRHGTGAIVRSVLAEASHGDVVLLHDGGGNRAETVAAVPRIVRALRARGYRIVSVPDLLGVSRDAVMPPEQGIALWRSRVVAWTLIAWFLAVKWVVRIGISVLALLALRTLVIVALALWHRRSRPAPRPGPAPATTVLVPAYNEEATIGTTLDSLLAQVGGRPEVIVIDDGSTDRTAEVAERAGVRVLRQANSGKWAALNRGVAAARDGVVVAIDADTVLDPHAVARLARWFTEPDVGAVSGTAKVGNRHTLLTTWQHVEYVTGFNLDRRAYAKLNAITVVPGAIGAWRRSALLAVGGYSGRTLAEDCDLTITLRRAGWRIAYEPDAVAWTEAPEALRGLARQRLRWTFGTFQVLWLNRGALFRRRDGALGWLALPFAWLYQVVLSPLAPAVDLIVLLALVSGGWTLALTWFAIATGAEMALSVVAFRMEGERAWPVLTLPLQRFAYRQLMYWTVLRALGRALRGSRLGWGKLARTGSVRAPTVSRSHAVGTPRP